VAHLAVAPDAPLTGDDVLHCVRLAQTAGYEEMLTSAVGPAEEEPFVEARFTVRARLHLLSCAIADEPPAPRLSVTRVTRREQPDVLALDDAAFAPFWRLGTVGLRDALDATPARQFRATRGGADQPALTGYAITGLASGQGYLQRVAVHPDERRCGCGRALVADAMGWLWRNGATRAYVNTQLDNSRALALYESFGFEMLPTGLSVLGRSL
jgi:ribosomal protein S18 acetylase RimI-like enzyme